MHALLSKMLARRVDRSAQPTPPPFDRTTLSVRGSGMLGRREDENVSLQGSASTEGEIESDSIDLARGVTP